MYTFINHKSSGFTLTFASNFPHQPNHGLTARELSAACESCSPQAKISSLSGMKYKTITPADSATTARVDNHGTVQLKVLQKKKTRF